jgi:hypothetical protein
LTGLGKVILGADKNCASLYDRVQIELDADVDEGEAARKVDTMLTLLGLNSIMKKSTTDDLEKRKIMTIFRAFFPRDAFSIEESIKDLSLDDFSKKIIDIQSEMEKIMDEYSESKKIIKEEIYSGGRCDVHPNLVLGRS